MSVGRILSFSLASLATVGALSDMAVPGNSETPDPVLFCLADEEPKAETGRLGAVDSCRVIGGSIDAHGRVISLRPFSRRLGEVRTAPRHSDLRGYIARRPPDLLRVSSARYAAHRRDPPGRNSFCAGQRASAAHASLSRVVADFNLPFCERY